MNKSKIVLSAVATIAAIGGAFALKSSKVTGAHILLDQNRDGVCTTDALGYVTTSALSGYQYNYATITQAETKDCIRKYYTIFN
ncbi:hypothetical protein HNQ91_002031 [Filimonas zeae]|uniref:Uncharacterized protein n=1 Tax=Filimonas zeae TaxID=1737353 RepID=A0A917IW00_9BACT|nr:DUF6520 family protein [Filimonas zeae]MDR6338980.1 hypothetical protein [Filimonas zeae]GGH65681.1 hypothetical protein GCM10011379_19070 [Filimonas zeae]